MRGVCVPQINNTDLVQYMPRRARDAAIIVIHTRAASIHPSKEGLQKLSCKIEKGVTTQFWEPILTLRNMIDVHESNSAYRSLGRASFCPLPVACNQAA